MTRNVNTNAVAGEIMAPMASLAPSLMVGMMPLARILLPLAAGGVLLLWLLGSLVSGGLDVLVVLTFAVLTLRRFLRRRRTA